VLRAAERARFALHDRNQFFHALRRHVRNRARHRQRRDDRTRRVAHRRRDAADRRLVFLEIESETALRIACHALHEGIDIGLVIGLETYLCQHAVRRFQQLRPRLGRQVEHHRLADSGRCQRHPVTHPRAHFEAARAGNLVDIKHVVAVAHAEVNGVVRVFGKHLQMRTRYRGERHLFERDGAEFDQLGAEQITAADLAKIARLHQRAHQTMRRAASRAERCANAAQIARAAGCGFKNREAAQQGLRAGLLRREVEQCGRGRLRFARLVRFVGCVYVGRCRFSGRAVHRQFMLDGGVQGLGHGTRCSRLEND